MRRAAGLLALLLILAGCKPAGSPGGASSAPGPGDTCGGYSWCTSPTAPVPVVSADNAPQGGMKECVLNLVPDGSGISMPDKLSVDGSYDLLCNASPAVILVTMRLEFKNAAGNWTDEAPVDVLVLPPLPGIHTHRTVSAACYPGLWRLEIYWSGIKSDHKTPFPDPGEPRDRTGDEVRLHC